MGKDQDKVQWFLNIVKIMNSLKNGGCQSKLDFEVIHWANVKYQAADTLTALQTTWTDNYSVKDDLPVSTVCDAQLEDENTKTDVEKV